MRAFAVALLLAAACPASAQDGETGIGAQRTREAVDALPVEARVELRKMYRRYRDVVARRLEMGWGTGVISEAVIEDVDEPFQPARLVESMIELRKKEIEEIEASAAEVPAGDPKAKRLRKLLDAKRSDLRGLVSKSKREKGLCRDWSDLIWTEFIAMNLEHWGARDERRATRPYHTAAIACSPADSPTVCLAFDPWEDGRASVFAYAFWDEAAPGGRFPAEYFLQTLPDRTEKAGKKP